jgi:AcrR family transcriptional regulator
MDAWRTVCRNQHVNAHPTLRIGQKHIHAPIDLFEERGYDETTVAEIAERTGLTMRTFLRYF